jgi:signal transduction histidine kinase
MIGNALFRRFFLRFLVGVGIAFGVMLALVHLHLARVVDREWREELRQEAVWLARHTPVSTSPMLASAWKTMHSAVRVTFFDIAGNEIADSHPERAPLELASILRGEEPPRHLAVVEELVGGGGVVVMSRPYVPSFPSGLNWELGVGVLLILGPMVLLLYPLVRSMSSTLHELGRMAEDVSAGHFGKTLAVSRTDEIGALVHSFNDMSSKLAEAERLSARLLNDVSHELRSPLGRIQVLAETVARRPDERAECLRGIEQEIELLDRLVEDLLQVARTESDHRSARHETFSLHHWAGETLGRLERSARSNGIGWTTRLPAEDSDVRADPQHLTLALANLVDNAIHVLRGRAAPMLNVVIDRDDETWSMSVTDNGPGIAEEHLEHVFRRFYRADEHRDRASGGVGLGLSLVRATAEAHGGEASIESGLEQGTCVTISLPIG